MAPAPPLCQSAPGTELPQYEDLVDPMEVDDEDEAVLQASDLHHWSSLRDFAEAGFCHSFGGAKRMGQRLDILRRLQAHPNQWQAVLLERAKAPSTVLSRLHLIQSLRPHLPEWLPEQWEMVRRTGTGCAQLLALTYRPRPLPPSHATHLLLAHVAQHCETTDLEVRRRLALIGLAASTGCHGTEAARLLPEDLDLIDNVLIVRWIHKTDLCGVERLRNAVTHPESICLLTSVADSQQSTTPLFTTQLVNSLPRWITSRLKDQVPQQTRWTWRGNRHTVVTTVSKAIGLQAASALVHHRSLRTTARYADLPVKGALAAVQALEHQ